MLLQDVQQQPLALLPLGGAEERALRKRPALDERLAHRLHRRRAVERQLEPVHRGARAGVDHDAHARQRARAGVVQRHRDATREVPGGADDGGGFLLRALDEQRQLLAVESRFLEPAPEQRSRTQRRHQLVGRVDLELVVGGQRGSRERERCEQWNDD